MTRGKIAAGVAAAGVGLAVFAVLETLVFAVSGAYLLVLTPLVGLMIAMRIYRALHTLCTSGDARAEAVVAGGIVSLVVIAFFGVSFGGFALLGPALLLAIAAVLTPRATPASA